jgi:hypothetical protein
LEIWDVLLFTTTKFYNDGDNIAVYVFMFNFCFNIYNNDNSNLLNVIMITHFTGRLIHTENVHLVFYLKGWTNNAKFIYLCLDTRGTLNKGKLLLRFE